MTDSAYIGIDLGTSGCRAIAINESGDVIAQSQQAVPSSLTTFPKSEYNPQQQWLIVESVLKKLFAQLSEFEVKRIAVDATSGSILLVDSDGNPITPILMYNDTRATEEAEKIKHVAPAESGAHGASSGLAKLIYIQKHFDSKPCFKILHQADWINFNLGAELGVSDYNNALKTGYDPVSLSWPEWMQALISTDVLPTIVQPGTAIGQLSTKLCNSLAIDYQPHIVAGTTDSIAALLATGISKVGEGMTSLGSTLVLKFISDKPIFKPERGIYSHRLGKSWLLGGASNSGGAVLCNFFTIQQLKELSSQIDLSEKPPSYYPLLSVGERFPELNSNKQPQLTPRPVNDEKFLYGMLAGIADIEREGYQLLQDCSNNTLTSISTVGGGSSNNIWQTIRQQRYGVPLIRPEHTEAAYGAATLARDQLQHF